MNVSNAGSAASGYVTSGASAPMSPLQKMSDLFGQIDSSGSGTITKDQFEQAFQTLNPPPSFQAAGADNVWSKLDPNGSGSVSQQDFVSTMTSLMKQLRGHHHGHQGSKAGATSLDQNTASLAQLGGSSGAPAATGSLLDFLA